MKEFWNITQLAFAAVGGWLGWFLGGCDGLLYALIHDMTPEEGIEFAVASSALKHSIESDFNDVTVAEVNALVRAKHGAGRVQR